MLLTLNFHYKHSHISKFQFEVGKSFFFFFFLRSQNHRIMECWGRKGLLQIILSNPLCSSRATQRQLQRSLFRQVLTIWRMEVQQPPWPTYASSWSPSKGKSFFPVVPHADWSEMLLVETFNGNKIPWPSMYLWVQRCHLWLKKYRLVLHCYSCPLWLQE